MKMRNLIPSRRTLIALGGAIVIHGGYATFRGWKQADVLVIFLYFLGILFAGVAKGIAQLLARNNGN